MLFSLIHVHGIMRKDIFSLIRGRRKGQGFSAVQALAPGGPSPPPWGFRRAARGSGIVILGRSFLFPPPPPPPRGAERRGRGLTPPSFYAILSVQGKN